MVSSRHRQTSAASPPDAIAARRATRAGLEPPGERRELGRQLRELRFLVIEGRPATCELEDAVAADRVERDREPFGALVQP